MEGKIVDTETITCQTPNYEAFGAMGAEIRVAINTGGWTVNKIQFNYFANTAARHSIAFGPGLLGEGVYGIEMPFMIQARSPFLFCFGWLTSVHGSILLDLFYHSWTRKICTLPQAMDTNMEKRLSGGDNFFVTICSEDGRTNGKSAIVDKKNGIYEVFYSVPMPGVYLVHIRHLDLGDKPEKLPIRGSPFKVSCQDPWTRQRVMGSTPNNRKGAQMAAFRNDLVVFGASDSGVCVCNTDGQVG